MGNQTSKPQIHKADQAVFKMKIQRDSLLKYNAGLNSLIASDIDMAKANIANKQRAIYYLRRKKKHQDLLSKTLQQIDVLEELISTVQFKMVEKDFISSIETGNSILKDLNREVSPEHVSKVMDAAQDEIEIEREASEALAMGVVDGDDEIEEELRMLEKAENKEDITADEMSTIKFPEVVEGELSEEKEKDEKKEKEKLKKKQAVAA